MELIARGPRLLPCPKYRPWLISSAVSSRTEGDPWVSSWEVRPVEECGRAPAWVPTLFMKGVM